MSTGLSGFLAKLSPGATLTYATYLGGGTAFPGALVVDANEEPIIAGSGQVPELPQGAAGDASQFVMKLDGSASQVLLSAYLPTNSASNAGITGLATDPQNNLLVFGQTAPGSFQATPGAYASPQPVGSESCPFTSPGQDAFVIKLRASDWQTVYGVSLRALCGIQTGALAIDSTGSAVLAMSGGADLPSRSPLLAGPACSSNSANFRAPSRGSAPTDPRFNSALISTTAACPPSLPGVKACSTPASRRTKAAARRRSCI